MAQRVALGLALLTLLGAHAAHADCSTTGTTPVPPGPACSAPGAPCWCLGLVAPACLPSGAILDAFAARGGCAKFGRPVTPVRPRLAFGGTYQQFDNGEIAHYSTWAGDSGAAMPSFVLSAVDLGTKIEVQWDSTAPWSYDFFILRWDLDNHAEAVEQQHEDDKQQQDVKVSGNRGVASFDATGYGTYVIAVEGCDESGFLFLSWADCEQGWSYPVYVDKLLTMPPPVPQPALPPIVTPAGVLDVPDLVQLSGAQQRLVVEHLCSGTPPLGPPHLRDPDGDHKGELAPEAALARLQAAEHGWTCGGAALTKPDAEVNQALRDAKVVSKPGTDVSAFWRMAAGAAAGGFLGMVLGAALTALLGGGPGIVGGIVSLVGAIAGGVGGLLVDKPGDYDMRLTGLIQIVYRFPSGLLPDARKALIDNLLTERGGADERKDFVWVAGVPTPVLETENHVWMTESARYLTNNLLAAEYKDKGLAVPKEYDNDANGMTDWILDGLRRFLVEDFYELNSRPYEMYVVQAIQNLNDFAARGATCAAVVPPGAPPSPRSCDVRRAARNVLDFLAAKFAMSSNELRRAAPFRRQPAFRDYPRLLTNGGDDASWRYLVYTGGSTFFGDERRSRIMEAASGDMLQAFQSDYRPPVVVTDLIRWRSASPTLQRFRGTRRLADVVEIYYRHPAFLISAGGKHDGGTGVAMFTSDEDAWALPTTLMPTRQGNDYRDFVRVAGATSASARVNTCVGPGFACGVNLALPPGLPAACVATNGNWTFIDFAANTAECPFDFGYYVAVFQKECSTSDCFAATSGDPSLPGGAFGFFEATPYRNFAAYQADVLALNGSWEYRYDRVNVYKRPAGGRVTFVFNADETRWGIVDYDVGDGKVVTPERRFDKWPVADGAVMKAPLEGCIVVENEHLQQKLVLDHTDVKRPRRTIRPLSRECSCPLPDDCLPPRAE